MSERLTDVFVAGFLITHAQDRTMACSTSDAVHDHTVVARLGRTRLGDRRQSRHLARTWDRRARGAGGSVRRHGLVRVVKVGLVTADEVVTEVGPGTGLCVSFAAT